MRYSDSLNELFVSRDFGEQFILTDDADTSLDAELSELSRTDVLSNVLSKARGKMT